MSYPDQITLSEYITARWKQLGVKHIFGCPGDFNLEVSPSVDMGFPRNCTHVG